MASEAYDVHVEREVVPQMELRCAWHPKYFGFEKVMREAAPGFEREMASHSICEDCRRIMRPEAA
jgi:hypothetical protein